MMSPLNEKSRIRVADLLARCGGDRPRADAELRTLIKRDHALLLDLVAPFLDGIIAHALSGKPIAAPSQKAAHPLSNDAMNAVVRNMTANLGVHPDAAPPRQKASAGHADTIRALAAAQAKKRESGH